MRARVNGIRSGDEWCPQMGSRHGAKVRDATGEVVTNVSYQRADVEGERGEGGDHDAVVQASSARGTLRGIRQCRGRRWWRDFLLAAPGRCSLQRYLFR